MWRQFIKKSVAYDGRSGVSIDDSRIAFAYVQREKDGTLRLDAAAFDKDANEEAWVHGLVAQVDGLDPARSPVTSVLPDGSYQLLLVEVPKVPTNEIKSAVRWQIKDLLDFPVDETAIEMFEMPEQSTAGYKSMAYAVATRRISIQEHIELLHGAGFTLDAIDIPELCTRNIATLLPQDADGVAFLHFTENHGILTVTRQGVLYHIRRINKRHREISSDSTDDFARTELVSTIVLEVQRSLDYYENHFDRRNRGPLSELVLAPGSDIGGLAKSLHEQLGLTVSNLDLNRLFEMQSAMSPQEQGDCLLAVGAALRSEPLAA
ncbi:MAG: hypothetical protein V3T18_00685 [Pseudomonadales bacterium]